MRWLRLFFLGCGWIAVYGLQAATAAEGSAREQGRAIYNYRCYFCHGYSGDAKTLAATYLTPPPIDFTRADKSALSEARIMEALEQGKPGTAMKSFRGVLTAAEMRQVASFVVEEFVVAKARNTRYHSRENGWEDHDRFRVAFPFATGELSLALPWDALSPEQAAGKRLYLASCVSCHDRGKPDDDPVSWDSRPLSYPRNHYSPTDSPPLDAISSASPYAKHDVPLKIKKLTAQEKRGERLFLSNCAFCHGADGTGKNWIGSFLEPHPRNLTDPQVMKDMTGTRLLAAIRNGLPNTSMPAWKDVLGQRDIDAIVAYIRRAFYPVPK